MCKTGEIELGVEDLHTDNHETKRRIRKRSKRPAPNGTSTTGLPPGQDADVQKLLERIEQLESRSRLEVEAQPAAETDGERSSAELEVEAQPAVGTKATGAVSAEEAAEVPAPPLVLSSVTMWMVQNASTGAGVLRASIWLFCGIMVALLEIVSLVSVAIALQWKPCFSQDDCRIGQACISFLVDGRYSRMTCEDCYFIARDETVAAPTDWLYPDIISPEERLGFGDEAALASGGAKRQGRATGGGGGGGGGGFAVEASLNSTVSASEYCLRQLREKAVALFEPEDSIYFGGNETSFEPHFRKCHFVKEALNTMSELDRIIVLLVLLLVAFGEPCALSSRLVLLCACPFSILRM